MKCVEMQGSLVSLRATIKAKFTTCDYMHLHDNKLLMRLRREIINN